MLVSFNLDLFLTHISSFLVSRLIPIHRSIFASMSISVFNVAKLHGIL